MIALLSCCVLGLFDVQRIPLETPNAVSFFAQVSEKEGPDLFVLDGRSLHRHDGRHPALQRTVNFAPGTSAVDVGDVDGDGIAEAVAIEGDKVLRYALDRGGDTFVCLPVLDLESGAVPSRAAYGPAKRYPGAPLMLDAPMPDFTGDGYADLALWHAPTPTLSPGALAKAMTSGTWPIWIRIHPFVPERGRFASRSSGGIEVRAPLTWFLEGYGRVPLRCLVSEDFDGDGRDDLAFAAQPTLFQMWRYEQRGLSDPPFFSHRFQESLQSVAQLCDVRGDGRNSLVLRGERSLFVLTPVMEGKEE